MLPHDTVLTGNGYITGLPSLSPPPSVSSPVVIMADTPDRENSKPTIEPSPAFTESSLLTTPTNHSANLFAEFIAFVETLSPELQSVCRNAYHTTHSTLRNAEAVNTHGFVKLDKLTPDVLQRAGLTHNPEPLMCLTNGS